MINRVHHFLNLKKGSALSSLKTAVSKIQYKKKILPFLKKTTERFKDLFTENIYEVRLLRKWVSRIGYTLLFILSFIALVIADKFDSTRPFIHSTGANEAIIGTFTVLLTLMIPLAIALLQSDSNVDFVRQTIVRTIIRFKWVSIVLVLICISLFIPSGIHVAGESLTFKNLYSPVLVCCVTFMIFSFYRSIRWLSDETGYNFSGSQSITDSSKSDMYGFSSYRFAQIMRLLQDASFQTWMGIWSQQFPIGYEDTIHESFFKRVDDVLDNKRRNQYSSISLELQSYNANFDNRNKLGYKFEYQNPERFFDLFSKTEKILSTDYVDSRLDGLWSGKDALKNISTKIIDALMDNRRVWSLFQAMNKYVESQDLVKITGKDMKDDELVRVFLLATFDAIKSDKVSAHDALSEVEADSGWAVTYENLYGKKRYNLSFLVENIYQKWLNDLLDQQKDKEYFMFNDVIVEHIFPGTDPIIMGKLYWLLHLAHSSDYLDLWIKESRPIGLMNLSGGFEFVGEKTKEDMWKEFRERTNVQEFNSVKLICNRYFRYLRTDFMKLSENLEKARAMDRKNLSESEVARLDDFIRIAQLIEDFYTNSDKEREKSSKTRKPSK